MGCSTTKQEPAKEPNKAQLLMLLRQMKGAFNLQTTRLMGEGKQLIVRLKNSLNKPSRSKYGEQQLLEEIVYKSHLRQIYVLLELQCESLIEQNPYFDMLQSTTVESVQHDQRKNLMISSIRTILFAIPLVDDGKISKKNTDMHKFQELIRVSYPQIDPLQESKHDIINYYKKVGRPNHEMIKEFVFNFCQEEQVQLSVFKSAGHNFTY